MAQKSQNRPIKLLSPQLQSPCSVSPSCLGTHVQESCGGFPSCPFSQVSTPQDPSESIGLTAQNLRCYFSKPRCPCYVLSHCFGGKQTPPPPNLTENTNSQFARFKVVLKAGYFRCKLYVLYMMWKRTYSSCCPWFLSRGQGCRGRTLLCFPCVSSHTPFPPDLYSVCDSLSHSLKKQTGTLTDAFPLKGSVHSKTKTTKSLSQVVSKKIHYISTKYTV